MRPRVLSPTGTEIGAPVSRTGAATCQTVGCVHGDRADAVIAEVLLDLEGQRGCIAAFNGRDVDFK